MRDEDTQAIENRPDAPLPRNRSLVFHERRGQVRSAVQAPADFVAQLIACASGLGQFRRARRQEPAVGASRYRTASALTPGFEREV